MSGATQEINIDLENQADELKAETRSLLPKSIFLLFQGRYIGSTLADDIPNTVKDISGLMIGRNMEISAIHQSFQNFILEAKEITYAAAEAVDLDELFQFSLAERLQRKWRL